jgi:catechol 2,3-dioxygenase-like lactoylglutathione lyase family enzyme
MRRFFLPLVALAFLGGCISIERNGASEEAVAQAATDAANAVREAARAAEEARRRAEEMAYDGAYFKRQLLVVTNMERALTLWRDVFGLEVNSLTTSGPNSYSREVFNIPPEANMRFATLNAGPSQQRTLALLEVTGVTLPPKTGIRTTGAVINARGNLRAWVTRARAMGLTVMTERTLETANQGTGLEQGILDWDGNVIVLYELPNADAPNRN